MSLVADTDVCICLLSAPSVFLLTGYRLDVLFSSFQEVGLSRREWALGVKGTELIF